MWPEKPRSRGVRKDSFTPNPKFKLLDQCREVMRFLHLAYRTEQTCLDWIRYHVLYCRGTEGSAPLMESP